MTFAVQRYRNNFSKIYELFLKDIGMKNQTGKDVESKGKWFSLEITGWNGGVAYEPLTLRHDR